MKRQAKILSGLIGIVFGISYLLLSCKQEKTTYRFLVSTYTTGTASKGIYILEADVAQKQTKLLGVIGDITDPSYTVNIAGSEIYAVSEIDSFQSHKQGALYHFFLDKDYQTNTQELIGTNGEHPCHLSFSNGWLSVANYSSGGLSFFKLDTNHEITKECIFRLHGKGTHTRQLTSHAHFTGSHPLYPDIVYAVDLGGDNIITYRTTKTDVLVIDSTPVASGKGPRHLAFHPTLPLCVLISELKPSVSLYAIHPETHGLTLLDDITLGEVDTASPSYASGIAVHPETMKIYALNRGENTISTITLMDNNRKLKLEKKISCGGDWPRSLSISLDGKYVFVANQKSNNISLFGVDEKNGSLAPIDFSIDIPSPTHVDFIAIAQ